MADPEENADSDAAVERSSADPLSRSSSFPSPSATDTGDAAPSRCRVSASAEGQLFLPTPMRKLGKYEIKSVLGQGGMGIVLEAWDPDLQRRVAIKVLGSQLALNATARRRFLREARSAASINHPNVLMVHAVEQQDDFPFLVMELVVGQTLKTYVAQRGPLDSVEAIRLSHQIALGLAAAHAQGVIHRDVKPGNVMLDDGGTRVRLTDFGLARAVMDNAELTSRDHAVGTPAYMSPEQVQGGHLDVRSDLFGFGCLIYFMITGKSPFQGRVTAETWNRILSDRPERLSSINPSVPPILSEIAERLLEKEPEDRYQSTADVAEMLGRLLAQLNQVSSDQIAPLLRHSHAPPLPRRRSRMYSRPRHLLAGGVMLLLLSSIMVGSTWPQLNPLRTAWSWIAPGPSNAPLPPSPGLPAKLHAIRVGLDAQSDCATIYEALQLAAQPCVITVAGPGPYEEYVDIVGHRYDHLQLVAESPVTWLCPPDAPRHSLLIANVRNVTVRGFEFLIQAPEAHGVQITDSVEDIVLQQCRFEHQVVAPKLSLLWIAATMPDWDHRLRVENCEFRATGRTSFCATISDGPSPGSHVEFIDCRFHALTTHLYVTDSCECLRVSGCVFVGGKQSLNFDLTRRDRNYPFSIVNNTFLNVKHWLGLMDSFRTGESSEQGSGGEIVNNLILGGERATGGEDQFDHLFENWRIAANWWERDGTTRSNADHDGQLAVIVDQVELMQRSDENESTYLVPVSSSPLTQAGVGGDLPIYIGALEPLGETQHE